MKLPRFGLGLLLAATLAVPCAQADRSSAEGKVIQAVTVVHPTPGQTVSGQVWFTEEDGSVLVVADIQGLPPKRSCGIHICEFADATSPDGLANGDHYNPTGQKHGGPNSKSCHAGDLGNLKSDATGRAHLELRRTQFSINGPKFPILGRSVVIDSLADDLKSQPAGNSGQPIGFGVVGLIRSSSR